jgi:hypothetical protein
VHFPAPTTPAGEDGAFWAPGDLVEVAITEASTNYCIAAAPTTVTRTPAGRATEAAMAAGDGWSLGPDAVLTPPVGQAVPAGRSGARPHARTALPVLPA